MLERAPWWTKYAIGGAIAGGVLIFAGRKAFAKPKRGLWDYDAPLEDVYVTQGWWEDRAYRGGKHQGLDMRAKVGTPVYAIGPGTVVKIDNTANSNAGLYLTLRHPDGMYSRYLHMSGFAPGLHAGQQVERGQLIGFTGASAKGMNAVSPHLHFDMAIAEDLIPLYKQMVGPEPGPSGFGWRRSIDGVMVRSVPAEPFIPGGYRQRAFDRAKKYGYPMNARATMVA